MSRKTEFKTLSATPAIVLAGLLFLLSIVASCSNELDNPPVALPVAKHAPNMTIAELKARYWQEAVNYIDTIHDDAVIHGWVVSSDESGNIYKKIYLQDESGMGLTVAINQGDLYQKYREGQELVLNLRECYIGKYNGQQELGFPDTANYRKRGSWQMGFMSQSMWESMAELNGFFNLAKVDTMHIGIADLANKTDSAVLLKFQGALVRINGVSFKEANGVVVYAPESVNYTNRTLVDAQGRTLVVRTNNHADFALTPLPTGKVDVVGVLDFYTYTANRDGTWQLSLRSINDVIPAIE